MVRPIAAWAYHSNAESRAAARPGWRSPGPGRSARLVPDGRPDRLERRPTAGLEQERVELAPSRPSSSTSTGESRGPGGPGGCPAIAWYSWVWAGSTLAGASLGMRGEGTFFFAHAPEDLDEQRLGDLPAGGQHDRLELPHDPLRLVSRGPGPPGRPRPSTWPSGPAAIGSWPPSAGRRPAPRPGSPSPLPDHGQLGRAARPGRNLASRAVVRGEGRLADAGLPRSASSQVPPATACRLDVWTAGSVEPTWMFAVTKSELRSRIR